MVREFELLSVPASAGRSAALSGQHRNEVLGDIRAQRVDGVTTMLELWMICGYRPPTVLKR